MPCCGQKRQDWQQQHNISETTDSQQKPPASHPVVQFEYIGETGLTVFGPVTNNRYRFNGRSDRQAVDERDASGLMAVPKLRLVRHK